MTAIVDVLTTGGTISLRSNDLGVAGADTGFTPQDLGATLELPDIEVRFRAVLDKGSKDIDPADWRMLAQAVADSVNSHAAGIVVLHGTDTMHYTAAALSFMVRDLPVPVVLTGSMVPGGDPGSDSSANLRDAARVAARADLAEVCIVFSADAGRSHAVILRGNRARKVHSTAIDAFASPHREPLGTVDGDGVHLRPGAIPRAERSIDLSTALDADAILVKLTPQVGAAHLRHMLAGASGAVLEGTGAGHLKNELHEVVAAFGRPTVMTTQVARGGEQLGRYATDHLTLELPNVIPGGDMTSETALVKLMWVLARGSDVRELMLRDVAGERSSP